MKDILNINMAIQFINQEEADKAIDLYEKKYSEWRNRYWVWLNSSYGPSKEEAKSLFETYNKKGSSGFTDVIYYWNKPKNLYTITHLSNTLCELMKQNKRFAAKAIVVYLDDNNRTETVDYGDTKRIFIPISAQDSEIVAL